MRSIHRWDRYSLNCLKTARLAHSKRAGYHYRSQVVVDLPDEVGDLTRQVRGDIAWGGNWFFLVEANDLRIELSNLAELNRLAKTIRRELGVQAITGADGAEIDHIELFGRQCRKTRRTPATSSYVLAVNTIARRAAQVPMPKLPVWPIAANWHQ